MGPAATLSILVKAQGAAAAAAEIRGVDTAARGASGNLDKASNAARKHSGVLSGLGKVAGLAGLAMGGAGLAKGISSAISEYREAQKVGAQTNAVLKSTGGAAGVTKKHIENLAGAISKKSGIDDEAIQSGENLLLTFTGIRNEVGKGNNIFDQATQTITDMSVALGQSGKSSAIQLGKALNDPIKGITALRRVGVSFTDQQKSQIETLTKSGDKLGAQKIILKELTKEFGGSAAAQATSGDKLKVSLGNLAEAAGSVLVPALDKIARFASKMIDQFVEGKGIASVIIPVFQNLAGAIGGVVKVITDIVNGFKDGNAWAVILVATLAALTAGMIAYKTITFIVAQATKAWAAAQILLDAAMDANPIVIAIAAIAALGAALFIAYQKSETFRNIINAVWGVLQDTFGWVKDHWQLLLAILTGPFGLAALAIKNHAGDIKDFVVGAFNGIVGAVKGLASTIAGLGSWVIEKIVGGMKAATAGLLSVGGWLKNRVMDGLTAVTDAIQSLGGWVINRVVDGAKATTAGLLTVGGWIKNRVLDGLNAVIDTIQGLGGWIINRVVEGIRATTQGLLDIGGWLKNRLLDGLSSVKDGIMGLGGSIIGWIVDGLKAGAIKVQDFLNDIIDVINKLPMVEIKHIAVIGKAKGGAYGSGPIPAGLARGGAFARTGGKVTSPITLMGEEAPRYPEYVIPTNPAYRNRAGGLLGQAATALGFAAGGRYSKDDLKKLWISQQGNPNTANVAAAVALAESGGDPYAPSPNPAGGINMGLWQIWSGNPGATFDPAGNARTAIRMSANGTDWHLWEAFTNGRYKQYLGSGLDAVGGLVGKVGGIVGDLLSKGVGFLLDQLPGTGSLPDWLKGTGKYILDHVTGWVKDKVSGILGSLSGGGGETSTSGLVPQVKRAVDWARSHGWHGTVTSGFRSYSEQAALYARYLAGGNLAAKPGTSSHETGQAVDVTDPAGFARALMNAPAMSKIYNRLGAADPVHFSVSGYKMGGVWPFVGSYATGGVVPRTGLAMVHKGETISPVGATTVVEHHYHGPVVQDKDFIQYLRNIDKNYGRQNGRPAFGG